MHCLGAIYCDKVLRRSGFNGEGYRSGAVIAVKTHYLPWGTNYPVTNASAIANNYYRVGMYTLKGEVFTCSATFK